MRGQKEPEGTERLTQNGYWQVKTPQGWRYKHQIILEEKLGRPIDHDHERVYFADGDKQNLDPDNLEVRPIRKKEPNKDAMRKELHEIRDRVEFLESQLEEDDETTD